MLKAISACFAEHFSGDRDSMRESVCSDAFGTDNPYTIIALLMR
ncbi:MAG: hypothetical protein AB7V25_03190 [Mangrovibacterium sp.]